MTKTGAKTAALLDDPLLLRPDAAAAKLGVSKRTLEMMAEAGDIEIVPIGTDWRVPIDSITKYIEKSRTTLAKAKAAGLKSLRRRVKDARQ